MYVAQVSGTILYVIGSPMDTLGSKVITVSSCKWGNPFQGDAVLGYYQGLIEPQKVVRGHVTHIPSITHS